MIVIDGFVEIRPGVRIMSGVTIGVRGAGRGPIIGRDVTIGTGAKVLGNVRVGKGAVVGANAVVLDNVPSGATVVGVPARPVTRPRPAKPRPRAGRPIVFLHVMRTGGFAFLQQIRSNFAPDEVYPDRALDVPDDDVLMHVELSHIRALPEARKRRIRVYAGHFPYVVHELFTSRPIMLTVLRDPVERTVSLLRVYKDRKPQYRDASLEEIYEDPGVYRPLIENHQTKIFSMTSADAPLSYRDVIEIDDARLALAKDNLARVDVVGLYEQYDEFLRTVRARFGWRADTHIRANAAEGEYELPVELRKRIARDNAIDRELYEYACRLVAGRSGA
jgi:hypothetical protein